MDEVWQVPTSLFEVHEILSNLKWTVSSITGWNSTDEYTVDRVEKYMPLRKMIRETQIIVTKITQHGRLSDDPELVDYFMVEFPRVVRRFYAVHADLELYTRALDTPELYLPSCAVTTQWYSHYMSSRPYIRDGILYVAGWEHFCRMVSLVDEENELDQTDLTHESADVLMALSTINRAAYPGNDEDEYPLVLVPIRVADTQVFLADFTVGALKDASRIEYVYEPAYDNDFV